MLTIHFMSKLLGTQLRAVGTLVSQFGKLWPRPLFFYSKNQLSLTPFFVFINLCLHLNLFSATVLGLTCSQLFQTLRCFVIYLRTSGLFFLMCACLPTTSLFGVLLLTPHCVCMLCFPFALILSFYYLLDFFTDCALSNVVLLNFHKFASSIVPLATDFQHHDQNNRSYFKFPMLKLSVLLHGLLWSFQSQFCRLLRMSIQKHLVGLFCTFFCFF